MPAQAVEQASDPAALTAAQIPSAQLHQLVDDFFQRDLALNPRNAPARGVNAYNGQFGD
ncbi:hypothetical protein [Pseudomonas sp. 2FE]|uniref:hypothetical protein n=1 Tax=Pseudomonas sp. 2FE TaxID=2502190 RepID=UPI0014857F5E|nr:hypothetical protein [Pseudomonas sp. 2FE]